MELSKKCMISLAVKESLEYKLLSSTHSPLYLKLHRYLGYQHASIMLIIGHLRVVIHFPCTQMT